MARFILLLLWMGFSFHCFAQVQNLITTDGGYIQANEFNVSWSLGETVTETYSAGNHTLTQGFQQSKIEPVGVIDQKNPFTTAIEVFPNPTQGLVYIKLKLELIASDDLPDHFTLYDIQGKQLSQGLIPEETLILDLNTYSGAVYYLRLYNSESNSQSTVIIQKIN